MTAQTSAPEASVEPRRPRRAAHARPAEGQPAARRDRARNRRRPAPAPHSVRARIVCLLALPVVSLTSLWGIAAVDTISAAFDQSQLHTMDSSVGMPLDGVVVALQQERSTASAYLAAHEADPTAFESRVAATRSALNTLQTGIDQSAAAAANLGGSLSGQLSAATQAMNDLTDVRDAILGRATTALGAYQAYSGAIDDALTVQATLAGISGAPHTAQAALALSEAREQLAVQDALISGAQAAGTLDAASYQQFIGALYAERAYLRQATTSLPDPTANTSGSRLAGIQNAVATAGPGRAAQVAASTQGWSTAAPAVLADLDTSARAAAVPAAADPYGRLLTTGSGFGVLLGLFALIVSLLISVGIGRRLVTDLVELRDYALDLAGRKLPETMARLRAGQLVEPGEQAPPLDPGAGELGQVADALAVASRAAMQAAIERAELVSGVSGVFLNLARRSQILVHRQLALLDTMERQIEEPDHLEDLFRLDHLATRMRRHAEGLIILSGATPGRAWRNPVDLTDVVRAAAAEAEDYARVEVRRMPQARVLGPAVADLTHLLAELIENATSFSPPHTRVVVGGEPVGSGFAIEIEDRGLGMSPEALREANRRIGESSGDDLFDSDRLGLFVVSRLARRHDIRVSLCASAYGGITSVVLIPSTVMQPPGSTDRPPTAEHDLGVSGAMPHGPLTGPERPAGAAHDGLGESASSNPVMQPEHAGATQRRGGARKGDAARTQESAPRDASPDALPGESSSDVGGDEQHTGEALQDSAGASSFSVPHANGHSAASGTARARRFDVLAPPPRIRDLDDSGPFPPLGPDGLPHRVRQANLAPQLRADGAAPAEQQTRRRRPGGPRPPRSPEENRATMSAFQRGFIRGRAEEPADPPASAPPAAEADPAGPADHDERGDGPR